MEAPPVPRPVEVRQWRDGQWRPLADVVSHEVPVSVAWEGGSCRLWAWPQDIGDLALGHVLLDRLHDGPSDGPSPVGVRRGDAECVDGVWHVRLMPGTAPHAVPAVTPAGTSPISPPIPPFIPPVVMPDATHGVMRADVSGGAMGHAPQGSAALFPGRLSAPELLETMRMFMGAQGLWDGTGCFHRAGVFSVAKGEVVRRAEDIGRHNCIDRLAGWAAREGVDLSSHVLLVSARVTASLFAKARRAGFVWVVSRSAVTTASVDMARAQGVTLVGFARDREERFTVFTDSAGRVSP